MRRPVLKNCEISSTSTICSVFRLSDDQQCLVGIVMPSAIEDARRKRSVKQYLGLSGIIGGEEFRSMPLTTRSGWRLSWLSLNIVLNIIAASVIALKQDTSRRSHHPCRISADGQ